MSDSIFPPTLPEGEISVSGVGHGKEKGTITIKQNGRTVELHNVTIVRAPQGRERAAFESTIWMALPHAEGNLLVEKQSLLHALHEKVPGEAAEKSIQTITALFKKTFVTHLAGVIEKEAMTIRKVELKREAERREKEGEAPQTVTLEEEALQIAKIKEKARATAEVIFEQMERPPEAETLKIKGTTYPIRMIRDPETKEIGFYVSMGRLAEGGEKVIKDVVQVSNGQIKRLVKASPKKVEAGGRKRTAEEVAAGRAKLAAEAAFSKEMRRRGVPHVLNIWEVSYPKGGITKRAYMMERCEGDLMDVVEPAIEGDLVKDEALVQILPKFLQLLKALQGIHGAGLVYRDLKPNNLLRRGNEIRLSDFGFVGKEGEPARLIGSSGFIAPELYSVEGTVSGAADMWSFGVLLYYGVTGRIPEWDSIQEVMNRLHSGDEEMVRDTVEGIKPFVLSSLEAEMNAEKEAVAGMGLEEEEVSLRQKEIETRYAARMRSIEEATSHQPVFEHQFEEFTGMLAGFRQDLQSMEDGVRKPIFALIAKLLGPFEERPTAAQAYEELHAILVEAHMIPQEG